MNHTTPIDGTTPTVPVSAPQMAQGGSVAQTAMQNAPHSSPVGIQETAMQAEGGGKVPFEDGESKGNIWGEWIAIGLISLTLVSLIMQIAVHRKSIKKVDSDDETLMKDMKEVKMNLKRQMGDKYEELG